MLNVPLERVDIADWPFPQRREDHEWGASAAESEKRFIGPLMADYPALDSIRSPAPPRRPDRGRRHPSSKACAARLGFTVEAAQDSHSQPCIIDRDVHIKIGSLA